MDKKKLRITILTTGRFHLLDLGRELAAIGHDVAFYSCVPQRRAVSFGLPPDAWRSMDSICYLLFWLSQKIGNDRLGQWLHSALQSAYARSIRARLMPCDFMIVLSGLMPGENARLCARAGARLWIERGSSHYLTQLRILEAMPTGECDQRILPDPRDELEDYNRANRIVVPAIHVVRSFLDHGIPAAKLFRNPYGVDLRMFAPTPVLPAAHPPTIIMVGRWSLRKGCDVLTVAWREMPGVRLRHVGSVGDCPLPPEEGFEHFPAVQQSALRDHYAQAHVIVLASREEGMAVVQAQALSCGLRLVCSDRTGGEDLKKFLRDPSVITVVPSDDAVALCGGLKDALVRARAEPAGVRDRLGAATSELTWAAYGRRYSEALWEDFGSTGESAE